MSFSIFTCYRHKRAWTHGASISLSNRNVHICSLWFKLTTNTGGTSVFLFSCTRNVVLEFFVTIVSFAWRKAFSMHDSTYFVCNSYSLDLITFSDHFVPTKRSMSMSKSRIGSFLVAFKYEWVDSTIFYSNIFHLSFLHFTIFFACSVMNSRISNQNDYWCSAGSTTGHRFGSTTYLWKENHHRFQLHLWWPKVQ
jgi:hypothetical protein